MDDDYPGYPYSDPEDLKPVPGQEPMMFGVPDVVDARVSIEGRTVFRPDGAGPDGLADREDLRSFPGDIDHMTALPDGNLLGGRVMPTDRPNYSDNLAYWSRARR